MREARTLGHGLQSPGLVSRCSEQRQRSLTGDRDADGGHGQVGVLRGPGVHVFPDHGREPDAGSGAGIGQQRVDDTAFADHRQNPHVGDDAALVRQGAGILPVTTSQTEHIIGHESGQ